MQGLAAAAAAPARIDGPLWAMTSYFNSARIERRRTNFTRFRASLGVPLIAIELGHDQPFELTPADADILIQLRGGDPLWQKERLLNIALDALPDDCRYVAWLDSDVILGRSDWPDLAVKSLQSNALLQLFHSAHYLKRDFKGAAPGINDTDLTRTSIPLGLARGLDPIEIFRDGDLNPVGKHTCGFAWAARRDLIDRHRLFDTCIVGGGDRALIAAALDCIDHVIQRQRMTRQHADQYRAWAEGFRDAVGGAVGWIDTDLFHLWHGPNESRQRRERYWKLGSFNFDPTVDIALSESGVWRWNSAKPEMHAMVRDHLAIRCEGA